MRMKILHTVESYTPAQTGMAEVCRQISERLADKGHDVTVATTKLSDRKSDVINNVKIIEFSINGNFVRGISGEVEKYEQFLINSDYDIVTNFAAQQWASELAFPLLNRIKGKKVFVPTGFSALYMRSYKKYYLLMPNWMKQYDMNVFLSNDYRDINFARQNEIDKIIVIPNGADEREFLNNSGINFRNKYGISKDEFLILHVGSRTGFKGHYEALKIFGKAIITNAVFVMIGNESGGTYKNLMKLFDIKLYLFKKNNEQRIRNKKVIVIETSRAETVRAFIEADLFLFPSNIECSPLVLFECMASKTPFMATDVGNAREITEWSNCGVVMPTKHIRGLSRARINEGTLLLEELYSNNSQRLSMAESGFKAWQEKFTWDKIADKYEKLYLDLLKGE
jgi:glycosyltransferase involved in cell wall biosynthesis